MNRFYERIEYTNILAPVSQAAAGNSTSTYLDCLDYSNFDVIVTFGAIAAGKKLTIDLFTSDTSDGTNAVKVDTVAYTAPAGGATSGKAVVSADVTSQQGRYYAVKITNDAASAVLVSAVALGMARHTPSKPSTIRTV